MKRMDKVDYHMQLAGLIAAWCTADALTDPAERSDGRAKAAEGMAQLGVRADLVSILDETPAICIGCENTVPWWHADPHGLCSDCRTKRQTDQLRAEILAEIKAQNAGEITQFTIEVRP